MDFFKIIESLCWKSVKNDKPNIRKRVFWIVSMDYFAIDWQTYTNLETNTTTISKDWLPYSIQIDFFC